MRIIGNLPLTTGPVDPAEMEAAANPDTGNLTTSESQTLTNRGPLPSRSLMLENLFASQITAQDLNAQVDGTGKQEYVSGPSYQDVRSGKAEMHTGEKGQGVQTLQEKLTSCGFPTKNDGYFGSDTERMLKHFQKANGLPDTGKLDQRTSGVLDAAVALVAKKSSPSAPAPSTDSRPSGPGATEPLKKQKLPDDPYLAMAQTYDMASDRLSNGYRKGQNLAFDRMVEEAMNTQVLVSSEDNPSYQKMAQARTRFMQAAHDAGF